MNELEKERMLDLLIAEATGDLSAAGAKELRDLEQKFPELKDDDSFELAAASFSIANLDTNEEMPAHLQAKILADADKFFAAESVEKIENVAKVETKDDEYQKTFAFEPQKRSPWQWLGWAVAGLACIALALSVWTTRNQPPQIVYVEKTPTPTPSAPDQLQQLLAANDTVKTNLANPKNPNEVVGDVVWSDSKQKGFVRLRGVPVNDKAKEQYQLWIVAANQDAKTPVDGGVFDVNQNGEVIIPIDAKVKVEKPTAFAITAERPGGVVVSKQEKVLALGKV
jgi:anti-sigma-K factor RskA